MKLILKQQVDSATCTSACLAMITDASVMSVVREFHLPHYRGEISPYRYLTAKGVRSKKPKSNELDTSRNGTYLAIVPELNDPDGEKRHHIIIQVIDGKTFVLDPNTGRGDALFYQSPSSFSRSKLSRPLDNFVLQLEIFIKEKKENESTTA